MKQAQGAIRQSPKGYADGGKVVSPWSFKGIANTVKGALTKTPEQEAQAVALAEYKARSAAERTQATPAPTQSAISSYAANTALDKRMQDAEQKKTGGAIRGKGTGTSDEVPIMASNGEFVIKAKAVKAIGLEVLEALNTIADKPDEKDSKAESMREYGEGSESATHETAEDAIEGMKCGGKVKKMATGGYIAKEMATGVPHMEAAGSVDEAQKRAQLLAQIPTGGTGAGPTPQPDPTQSASGTEIGRNVNNSLNALGGMGVVASVPLKTANAVQQGAMRAPPVLTSSIPRLPAPQVADFVAGMGPNSSVHAGQAAYKTLPVANEALQAGAKANQMAATTRVAGNASAGLGALDKRQTAPDAPLPAQPQSDYSRQMSEMGSSVMRGIGNIGQAAKTMALTAVSAPGYGLSSNNPTAPADASPYPGSGPSSAPPPALPGSPAAVAATGSGALPKPYSPAKDSQAANPQQPQQPPTAPTDGATPPRLNGVDGKDVGYGATRFDQPGKSPLFTNMTDEAGLADNAKLQARAPITAQNQGALDGMQARQDAGDQAARNKMQYDAEVAQAQAINAGQKQFHLEQAALKGNKAALKMLGASTDDATTRRGQDITAKGQEVQAGALRANQKLAQDRFGIEQSQEARNAAKAGIDAKQQARLQAAFDAYDKDPSEENASRVRVYTGKEKAPAPDLYDKVQTGVDPTTNAPIYSLYNKRTGEMPGQAKAATQAPDFNAYKAHVLAKNAGMKLTDEQLKAQYAKQFPGAK